jgi:hypothetical protein
MLPISQMSKRMVAQSSLATFPRPHRCLVAKQEFELGDSAHLTTIMVFEALVRPGLRLKAQRSISPFPMGSTPHSQPEP